MKSHPVATRVGSFAWLVLQAASVVAGILLAFAIDAWWSNRIENREKNAALVAIRQELIDAREDVQKQRVYRRAMRQTEKALMEAIAKGRYEDKEKTLDHRISELLYWSSWDTGDVIQRLPSSAHFTAIESPHLRQALISWQSVRSELASVSDQDFKMYWEVTMPYLARNASLPQLMNVAYQKGRAGDGFGTDPDAIVPLGSSVDHSVLLAKPEFAAVVVVKGTADTDVLLNLEATQKAIDNLIELIDAEIEATS